MHAIRFYGPRDMRYSELPMPELGVDDVLVKVESVGLCATDVEVFEGTMIYVSEGMTAIPFTPGHEWAGRVVKWGSDVKGFSEGDLVAGECSVGCRACTACLQGRYNLCHHRTETGLLNRDGGFAEYIAFPQFYLHHCGGIAAEAACLIEPTAVALNAIRSCRTSPADRVAVVGVGTIGLLAVQSARAYGARQVVAIDVNSRRLDLASQLGADATIDAGSGDIQSQVESLTQGHNFDVVVEASGRVGGWNHVPGLIAPYGRVALVGLFAGAECKVNFDPLVVKNVTLQGCLGAPNVWPEAIELIEAGRIDPLSLVTHRLPLSEFEEAVQIASHPESNAIKVLLKP